MSAAVRPAEEGGRLPVQAPEFVERFDVLSIGGSVIRNDKLIVIVWPRC